MSGEAPTAEQIARWAKVCPRVGLFSPELCSFEDWARTAVRWEKQRAEYATQEEAEEVRYGAYAMKFLPRPPKGMDAFEANRWYRDGGLDRVNAFYARRWEISAQRETMKSALRISPADPRVPTEEELIALALSAPKRRNVR